ncbi:MAG: integral rane sensor signal transduction histidine kinase [Solirubrobacterales bacterium]|nr:integral rane sensor signal transduction histidine kinase [Solirubrobacterales bacterium]
MIGRLPVRLKLTLAFTIAIAAVLTATALFLYLRLRTELDNRIDQSLQSRLEVVSNRLQNGSGGPRALARAVARGEEGSGFVQIVLPGSRTVVGAREGLGDEPVLDRADLARLAEDGGTYDLQSGQPELGPVRIAAAPVAVGTHHYLVAVGATLEERNEALSNVRTLLLIGGPIALILAALTGWVVVGAALRPVDRMLVRLEDGLRRERTFVADASHELRTPLTQLKMELELMRQERPDGDQFDTAIAAAIGDTDRLSMLSEDLLVLARSDRDRLPVNREEVDVGALFATVAARYPTDQVEVEGAGDGDSPRPTIGADRSRLEQALGNLVDNALAHGAPPVRLSAVRRPGTVELHVTDTGGGFPPDFIPQAFDRFSQASPGDGGSGTGLGLAIVRAIAEAHGGIAGAGNRDGGADVWLALPT